jgi:hypothetical protein
MVDGIDALGKSLLGRQDTFREQREDDLKKDRRRQRNKNILTGLLKFADTAAREKYDDWFGNEASRSVSRIIKQQKQMEAQRASYETQLNASGKSAFDYELSLVEGSLTPELLGKRIEGFSDFSKDDQNLLLYGGKDSLGGNVPGLYNKIAQQKLDARNEWAKNIKDLKYDSVDATQAWKKVNPNSKNLLGGAFDFFKDKITGSPEGNKDELVASRLKEITDNFEKARLFQATKMAGFSTEDSIKAVNDLIRKGTEKGLYERIGTVIKTESQPVEEIFTDQTGKAYIVKGEIGVQTLQRSDGSTYQREIKVGTGKDGEISSQLVNKRNPPVIVPIDVASPLTGDVRKFQEVFIPARDGSKTGDRQLIDITPADVKERINHPRFADVVPAERTKGYTTFGNHFKNVYIDPSAEDLITKDLLAVTGGTDSQVNKDLKEWIGTNTALVLDNLTRNYDLANLGGVPTFSGQQQEQIAVQILMLDASVKAQLQDISGVRQNFKGSASDYIDPSKVLFAIEALRSTKRLQVEKGGDRVLTDAELYNRVAASQLISGPSFNFNPRTDGESHFDAGEINEIKRLKSLIDENNEKNGRTRDRNGNILSLFNISVQYMDTPQGEQEAERLLETIDPSVVESKFNPKKIATAYQMMIGEREAEKDFGFSEEEARKRVETESFIEKAQVLKDTKNDTTVDAAVQLITTFDPKSMSLQQTQIDILTSFLTGRNQAGFGRDKLQKQKDWERDFERATGRIQEAVELSKKPVNQGNEKAQTQLDEIVQRDEQKIQGLINQVKEAIINTSDEITGDAATEKSLLEQEKAKKARVEKLTESLLSKENKPPAEIDIETAEPDVIDADLSLSNQIIRDPDNNSLKLNMNYIQDVNNTINRIAKASGDGPNEIALMQETIAAESNYGYDLTDEGREYTGLGSVVPNSRGMGQIDEISWKETKRRLEPSQLRKLSPKYQNTVAELEKEFQIDLQNVTYDDLNDPTINLIFTRLHYLRFPEAVPGTEKGRSVYYKDFYNTNDPNAKATPKKYRDQVKFWKRAGAIN